MSEQQQKDLLKSLEQSHGDAVETLEKLQEICRAFDKLIAEEGVFKLLNRAQWGALPPAWFIEICRTFASFSNEAQ